MNLGLRAKSALVLGLCILVAIGLAVAAGGRAVVAIEDNLGTAFARNVTQYNKQRILAPVMRELAVSQRLAESEVTRRWLLDENNPDKRALFFAEAAHYQRAFEDHSYFLISRSSQHYYFNDSHTKFSDQPRYSLKAGEPNDAWFFNTMKKSGDFNLNVDYDVKLKATKVWFNVITKDQGRNIGLAGTGLDLTVFLNRFISGREPGVTPMILNAAGAIQAHPNRELIDYSSVNNKGGNHSTIYRLLKQDDDQEAMKAALLAAAANSDGIQQFWATLNGQRELFAVTSIPELKWFVVTAVDLKAAQVIDRQLWLPPLLIGIALLIALMLAIIYVVNRLLLAPLLELTSSVRRMAGGNYDVALPVASNDELGELTRAFGVMAAQVRSHTDELESKVEQRTEELVVVNQQMAAVNKQMGDSIQYASLIQNAILPHRELAQELGDSFFVLWRPRDTVGGDFYLYRTTDGGCLVGIVDCAGHGVPGAFMTMIAYSALNVACDTQGLRDPAALLTELDTRIRAMLPGDASSSLVATNMDAGLIYLDYEAHTATFSGAKVSLYCCDGRNVEEIKGDRYAVGGKRVPVFSNQTVKLDPQVTFYLTTDGLLDQAGGDKGYGFGQSRFFEMMQRHAKRPLAEQQAALVDELAAYQGDYAQRDDITVISFRFA